MCWIVMWMEILLGLAYYETNKSLIGIVLYTLRYPEYILVLYFQFNNINKVYILNTHGNSKKQKEANVVQNVVALPPVYFTTLLSSYYYRVMR